MLTEMKQTIWPDPTMVASDVYKLVLENERVRVFDVHANPVKRMKCTCIPTMSSTSFPTTP